MEPEELQNFRQAMEVQFRHQLYNSITFPFLRSLGILHIMQGFGNEEVGFIGVLHLWWVNEDNGIIYDNPRPSPVKIIGMWKSNWLDDPAEAIEVAHKINEIKPYDEGKLIEAQQNFLKAQMEKDIQKNIMPEEDKEKEIILN
jgi:hypothetical protein